jgi:hypothetical protein
LVLVFQILLAVVLLAGLITAIMSIKNWHWAQMLLVLAIFLTSFGVLLFALEAFRIHRNIRLKLGPLEAQLAAVEAENAALENGADAAMLNTVFPVDPPQFDAQAEGRMPGMAVWTRRLQDLHRQRGRVWKGAEGGQVDPATGRVPVTIANPQPHGLEQDAIVYVFEEGEPNSAAPQQGAQYLGEFRVVEVRADGVTLESVYALDPRTGVRLRDSQKPWRIYETMPTDRHSLFAGKSEEQLKQLLPESSVPQYVRHGEELPKPAAGDAFDPTVAMFDEAGHRLGPDDAEKAVKWAFERPLRDYAFLFAAANRELVELLAEQSGLTEDIKRLGVALETAKKFVALRAEEKAGLTEDLAHMQNDRKVIETHLATLQAKLATALAEIEKTQAENQQYAAQLRERQTRQLEELQQTAPAPAGDEFLSAP